MDSKREKGSPASPTSQAQRQHTLNHNSDSKKKDPVTVIPFECCICDFSEKADYYGRNPNSLKKIISFKRNHYILSRDPFASNPGKASFLILGGDCNSCCKKVCLDCSIYYESLYCLPCASSSISFPQLIQEKIRKKISLLPKERKN
ncbi:cysteine-rich DPF motif domain-containing protein 1 [Lepeophtheirus salmonis]|uniref:cysteine-rich DPF motif domain-containing protein 1 n=1 Tax=Lepeophtheirus salmonis TaxID=72036 RepID=UPI001AE43600|nr:cysteine-rich DPF motif domain-containing protein 1-like [Lepeophtheirus salmonis]